MSGMSLGRRRMAGVGAGRRVWVVLGLTAAFWGVVALPALAVSSNDLIEHPEQWDRKEVTYRGEVIGDVMRRGRLAVLNVNDGTYAMGVWVPVQVADEVTFAGRYGVKGDRVEVRGIYYRACPEHGGDPDIHADRLTVVGPGQRIPDPFHRREAVAAAALLVVALFLAVWERRRRSPEVEEPQY